MTLRKKIIFEGQEIGLSQTMQKLQRQAEQMSSKVLENYTKSAKSSKDFLKTLDEEYRANQRLIQISGQDKKYQALEKYEKKFEEINRKEEVQYNKLKASGLKGPALDAEMEKASKGFDQQRQAVGTVKDASLEELKKSIEEQKKTNEILKQILNEDKNQWEQEFREDRKGVDAFLKEAKKTGLENLSVEDKAKFAFQSALASEEKPSGQGGGRGSILKDIIGAGIIRDLGAIIGQVPSARDAYDLVPGITRMSGAAIGAAGGAITGAFVLNPMAGATAGAELGQRGGEFAGNALARHFEEQENLQRARYGLKAVTGMDVGEDFSMAKYGLTKAEFMETAKAMALQTGTGINNAEALVGVQTGYGIDQSTLMGSARTQRRTGVDFGENVKNTLGIAQNAGIDRVLFTEMIQGQTELINSIGAMTTKVDPRNIMALTLEMNKIGGGFSLQDPRSTGFINTLNQGLTSPNEFGKAMNLSVLRNMDPNASILDLLEAEEQGLGGKKGREMLKGTVEQFTTMFGDDDLAVLALRSRFPGIPISDLKRMVKNKDFIDSMDTETMTQEADVYDQGNVAMRQQLMATVTDSFSKGALDGLMAIEGQMEDMFARVFQEAAKKIDLDKMINDALNFVKMPRNPFKDEE